MERAREAATARAEAARAEAMARAEAARARETREKEQRALERESFGEFMRLRTGKPSPEMIAVRQEARKEQAALLGTAGSVLRKVMTPRAQRRMSSPRRAAAIA